MTYDYADHYLVLFDAGTYPESNSTWKLNLTAGGVPPAFQVTAHAAPVSGVAPLQVAFTSEVSGGTPPYTVTWHFGDSTPNDTGSPSVAGNTSHTYESAGTYNATITVVDSAAHSFGEYLDHHADDHAPYLDDRGFDYEPPGKPNRYLHIEPRGGYASVHVRVDVRGRRHRDHRGARPRLLQGRDLHRHPKRDGPRRGHGLEERFHHSPGGDCGCPIQQRLVALHSAGRGGCHHCGRGLLLVPPPKASELHSARSELPAPLVRGWTRWVGSSAPAARTIRPRCRRVSPRARSW